MSVLTALNKSTCWEAEVIKINTTPPVLSDQHIQQFWAKVDKSPGQGPAGRCWTWRGSCPNKDGYGLFGTWRPRRGYLAHRLAFYLTHGRWPDNLACHRCDNPPCVNPDCLWDGTHAENARDSVSKGRHPLRMKERSARN